MIRSNNISSKRVTENKGKVIEYAEVSQFNKKYPEHPSIRKEDILKVIRMFHSNIVDETMNNIYGVSLPENIGVIKIVNNGATKTRPVDFKTSLEVGKIVRYRNWDTDNNVMSIRYSQVKRGLRIKHSQVYSFVAIRSYKKLASAYFRKNWQRCVKITNGI